MLRFPGTLSGSRNVTLVHGVRYPSDFAYREELSEYEQRFGGRFKYLPIASRADASFSGFKGRVQKVFLDDVVKLDPTSSRLYLCGNPAMIEEMEGYLGGRGLSVHHGKKNPSGRVHVEKYW